LKIAGDRNIFGTPAERDAQDGLRMIFLHNVFMAVKLNKAPDLLNARIHHSTLFLDKKAT
jgi:hypothetical protein